MNIPRVPRIPFPVLQRVLVFKVKNFINKERFGSRKTKECKRRDHKIKFFEEIKNIRQPDFEAVKSCLKVLMKQKHFISVVFFWVSLSMLIVFLTPA